MAKKKVKKVKVSKKKAVKKAKVSKKKIVRAKKGKGAAAAKKVKSKEKVLGKVAHFFDKISVGAIKVLSPINVGDVIHIKGHTTDFVEKIESMQIEHQNVLKAQKGDEIGIKMKDHVREHDMVYLGKEEDLMKPVVQPVAAIQQPKPPA